MPSVNGLADIVAAETELSMVDGQRGRLVYRGYEAPALAKTRRFSEVAHLLWTGRLPDPSELRELETQLTEARTLPPEIVAILDALPPEVDMMSALRTAVSAIRPRQIWPPTIEDATRIAGMMPTIVAYRHAKVTGQTPVPPRLDLSHVANYLYMLNGRAPSEAHTRALEAYLILTIDHGLNASTFAGRVAASTQSDLSAALTAALAAMKGPLHGGAPSLVMDMLDEIGSRENAAPFLRAKLERGERLMGFGHRVYKTRDPRAEALRDIVIELTQADPWFDLAAHTETIALRLLEEYKPGRELYTNVEYWAAAILRTVEIPKPIYTATFSISRVVGWSAHVLEQAANNRLIRPQSTYVGPLPA
ncbi:citrate synthase/methylcitrate synthase [Alicyclobacillus cycloheptanicus]|uniref:Citrate synthase n=1 Tax=Alicyclobacillus cycloheptanicus TaxID=1457 RepID=A0ABT9XJI4_9BACL|nr:citrate synthase/methylcitrate synthase [Alicyclobacillus cycloheptanicus]MDQ0190204.1 citrate synthase [Alicyclobacillus cycloheptanicus]WDM02548.1 citrate synthase/methylcitrate synthase [Alicyclobacillus cycloheptanicus]